MSFYLRLALALAAVIVAGIALTFEYPPIVVEQRGYRGLAIEQNHTPKALAALNANNVVPAAVDPQEPSGQKSSEAYQNVKVLGDLDSNEFLRLMTAITAWVAPEQGCTYCHSEENLADDSKYTKIVARRMLQMTAHINGSWQPHVAQTGVTCYTCHRGMPVPANKWYAEPKQPGPIFAGNRAGQNAPSPVSAYASLPNDVFTPFLDKATEIRVAATVPLPGTDKQGIKAAEHTYGLMMHFSQALGVNCTYCHNSRAFARWDQSAPQRVTAWHGIRMARDLNVSYLEPLASVFPDNRKGPLGDVAKVNCATCHQGAYKPLLGVSMLKDYPELGPSGPIKGTGGP
jgi:photosynthetic reaction center cytochrome c subunit